MGVEDLQRDRRKPDSEAPSVAFRRDGKRVASIGVVV
jgi:hypothetical protein